MKNLLFVLAMVFAGGITNQAMAQIDTGDFTVADGTSSFVDGVLTITGGPITVKNKNKNPYAATSHRIVIDSASAIAVTLNGVNIDTSTGHALAYYTRWRSYTYSYR